MPVLKRLKPKHSLFWIPLALLLSFSIYFALKWGLKPKPISQINPTQIENLEQVGVLTYRRLRPALRQEKMVLLGSGPWLREYEHVWNGFIAAARQDNWLVDVVFEDPSLRPIKDFKDVQRRPLTWPEPKPELAQELKEHLKFGHLVIVHTTYNLSSHRGEDSLSKELESSLKRPWTAITMLNFAVTEEGLTDLQPHCEDEVSPSTRADYVACAAARVSRRYLRKHLDPAKMWMAMERHGLKDYFLYIFEPPITAPTQ